MGSGERKRCSNMAPVRRFLSLSWMKARSLPGVRCSSLFFFFFNDTATTEIYTLSLHDALPISGRSSPRCPDGRSGSRGTAPRSEEHTSELQSHVNLVCRLLLEKKKTKPFCSLRILSTLFECLLVQDVEKT